MNQRLHLGAQEGSTKPGSQLLTCSRHLLQTALQMAGDSTLLNGLAALHNGMPCEEAFERSNSLQSQQFDFQQGLPTRE